MLEYANNTWNSNHRYHVDDIEAVQRRFTRHILEAKRLPYEERLKKINLPSLEFSRDVANKRLTVNSFESEKKFVKLEFQ